MSWAGARGAGLALLLCPPLLACAAPFAATPPAPRPEGLGAPAPIAATARPTGFDLGPAPRVGLLGAVAVTAADPRFGGLSAIDVAADGSAFIAVSDRGAIFVGRLTREGDRLTGVQDLRAHPLRGPDGAARPFGLDDAEGIAVGADGAIHVSFEGDEPRIWRYPRLGAAAEPIPPAPGFARLQRNSGLEALAIDAAGALLAIPERSGALDRPFPVFLRDPETGAWSQGRLPRAPPFLVTGADVGPDGLLYVIERDFNWLGGFAARIRRADLADWPDLRPETLMQARGGVDNMEGISAWRDGAGRIRLTLVSDDNFSPLQRTLIVDLAVED